ncbi:hypothetical protein LOAG_02747 [Loa loa]|uniref:Exportin-1/Importin-beta-like domain-containing protein n=1 Tax=Loa loa TaxID=7209 RepID=A0A1S0U5S9_LOALO|nr:hypothetical protein LOAG_02747 [Loa loa]EFO25742.2 hypothetical protein LOAG_02747 [Loa loa]
MPETYSFCLMIVNILSSHPIYSLIRAEATFPSFLSFIPILMESFAVKLSDSKETSENDGENKNVNKAEKDAVKECHMALKWAYISAIQHLYKGWLIILQNLQFIEQLTTYWLDFAKITNGMISSFTQTVFSVPFGDREEVSVPLPDREIYKEILIKIGAFSSYFLDQTLSKTFSMLVETVEEFLTTMEKEISVEELNMWRENMHWIMLIVGHVLVQEDDDRNCVFQSKLLVYYAETIVGENNNINSYAPFIEACINTPQALTDPPDVDIVIKMIGTVFAWCSIEDELLKDHGVTAISVELCGTSLWCAKRLISALGLNMQKSKGNNHLAKVSQNITQILVDFSLQKAFRIFEIMPDEKKTCMDAIELLSALAKTMYCETSKSILLFSYLSTVQIDQLSMRTSLIKALVQIGSIIDDEIKQRTLFQMILIPIRIKFISLCDNPSGTNENIDDLLDCFCAVIDAAQKCSASFLLGYLEPVLKRSVELFSVYKDSLPTINAILQFFDCLTKRMHLFCDNHNDTLMLYQVLFDIVQIYEMQQTERYKKMDSKEKASDLILLLDILTNTLNRRSRPIDLSTGEPKFKQTRSDIIGMTWNMLLSIMRFDFLKLPLLRKNFYRFLECSTEASPECIIILSQENFLLFVDYLKRGLQTDVEKDDLLSTLKDRFEQEVSINAARAIANLGFYFAKNLKSDETIKTFSTLIDPTFTICLNTMWQEEAESLATSTALYSLLCCDEDGCKMYVKNLLSREVNHPNRSTLRAAFRSLMSHTSGNHFEKSAKNDFYDRLKGFLTKAEGLLVVD